MTDISKIEDAFASVSMLSLPTEEQSTLRVVAAHNDAGLAHT
jgi:hypothetical protein